MRTWLLVATTALALLQGEARGESCGYTASGFAQYEDDGTSLGFLDGQYTPTADTCHGEPGAYGTWTRTRWVLTFVGSPT